MKLLRISTPKHRIFPVPRDEKRSAARKKCAGRALNQPRATQMSASRLAQRECAKVASNGQHHMKQSASPSDRHLFAVAIAVILGVAMVIAESAASEDPPIYQGLHDATSMHNGKVDPEVARDASTGRRMLSLKRSGQVSGVTGGRSNKEPISTAGQTTPRPSLPSSELIVKPAPWAVPWSRYLRQRLGATLIRTIPALGVEVWRLRPGLNTTAILNRLNADPRIIYAEPNYRVHALPPTRRPNPPHGVGSEQEWQGRPVTRTPATRPPLRTPHMVPGPITTLPAHPSYSPRLYGPRGLSSNSPSKSSFAKEWRGRPSAALPNATE